jgi:ring-1,2-phenylacetyl-CoA epoxidase subunit PaaD
MSPLSEAQVWAELGLIADPEIPVISLVELGVIREVEVGEHGVRVALRPTFAGCPALHVMRRLIGERLRAIGAAYVEVDIVLDPPWSTEDIRPEARTKLAAFGLAPAPSDPSRGVLARPRPCPRCGSADTEVRNDFGPTPCRSIHFCLACRQPFEAMKPV